MDRRYPNLVTALGAIGVENIVWFLATKRRGESCFVLLLECASTFEWHPFLCVGYASITRIGALALLLVPS